MSHNIKIGIAGWSYADWEGIVYTRSKMDQLEYVSRFVDCIEINSTFYRPPSQKNTISWLNRTSGKKGFFFTAKLNQEFTHKGNIDPAMVEQFHTGFGPMLDEGKLKHLLAQFRYDFADTGENRGLLEGIVENFCGAFELAIEVRHRSWEDQDGLKFLGELGVSVCNLDYPTSYDSFDLQHCIIGKSGYFRLHGRNFEKWFSKAGRDETYNYYYSQEELAEIKTRIDNLLKCYDTLTVIANNHYRGSELANAIELKAMLTGEKQPVPEGLLEYYPSLAKIAD